MPLLSITSNQQPREDTGKLLKEVSSALAQILGKPESYVMISWQHNPDMTLGGSTAPLAYLEIKSIGLPTTETGGFAQQLCALVSDQLRVAPDRIYIEFSDVQRNMWGWDGRTFA